MSTHVVTHTERVEVTVEDFIGEHAFRSINVRGINKDGSHLLVTFMVSVDTLPSIELKPEIRVIKT